MKKTNLLTAVLLIASIAASAHAEDNFYCVAKAVVQYSPGSHWDQLEKTLPQHLGFMASQLRDGAAQFVGPLLTQAGEPQGGLAIYNLADLAKVSEITGNDPLVVQEVATFTVKTWNMCVLK